MNIRKLSSIASAMALAIVVSSRAIAGPVNAAHIPAGARWIGHFDLDAARGIKGVAEATSQWCAAAASAAGSNGWAAAIGLDPMQDITAVTLHDAAYAGGKSAALLYVRNIDRAKLIAAFKARHADAQESQYGGRVLYSWTLRHAGIERRLTGAFANDGLIVVAGDEAYAKAALDTIDGKQAALPADHALLRGISANALFVARGLDVGEADRAQTRCPVLRNCTAAFVQWEHNAGDIVATYRLETLTPEAAQAYRTIVDGMRAWVTLRAGDAAAATPLLQGLVYGADANVFSLTWKTSVDAILGFAKRSGASCPMGFGGPSATPVPPAKP